MYTSSSGKSVRGTRDSLFSIVFILLLWLILYSDFTVTIYHSKIRLIDNIPFKFISYIMGGWPKLKK